MSSSLAAILIAAVPLIVALLALRFDAGERAHGRRLVGLLVGFSGVVALVGLDVAGRTDELLGAGAILLAATGYAAGPMVLKRQLSDLEPIPLMGAALGIAALVLTPAALIAPPSEMPAARDDRRSPRARTALHRHGLRALRRAHHRGGARARDRDHLRGAGRGRRARRVGARRAPRRRRRGGAAAHHRGLVALDRRAAAAGPRRRGHEATPRRAAAGRAAALGRGLAAAYPVARPPRDAHSAVTKARCGSLAVSQRASGAAERARHRSRSAARAARSSRESRSRLARREIRPSRAARVGGGCSRLRSLQGSQLGQPN